MQRKLPLHCRPLLYCFVSKASAAAPYALTLQLVSFTNFRKCSLIMHITLASLISCELVLHAFHNPSSHFVCGLLYPFLLAPQTRTPFQSTASHSSHNQSLQNLPIHSTTHLLSHSNSAPHFLIPPSIHPDQSAHTP